MENQIHFIVLTSPNGKRIVINISQIISMSEGEITSVICVGDVGYVVKESVDEIVEKFTTG